MLIGVELQPVAHIFKHFSITNCVSCEMRPVCSASGTNISGETASVWLGPARKRFRTHDFSTAQRHDGLIVNHKIAAVNGVQQAIARRLDTSQDPQDKQCRQQAYQDAKRQPEKQLSVPAFSRG